MANSGSGGRHTIFSNLMRVLIVLIPLTVGASGIFSRFGIAIDANERLAKAEHIPAIITNIDNYETRMGSSTIPWVSYKFTYNGKEYSPKTWRLYDEWSPQIDSKEAAEEILRPYQVGKTVNACVYPNDPSKSFIDPSNPNEFLSFYFAETAFAGLLCFGVYALTCLFSGKIKTAKPITSISDRRLVLPFLVSWTIFCDAMMIWYWTHAAPTHLWASIVIFALPLGFTLLGLIWYDGLRALFGLFSYLYWFFFSKDASYWGSKKK